MGPRGRLTRTALERWLQRSRISYTVEHDGSMHPIGKFHRALTTITTLERVPRRWMFSYGGETQLPLEQRKIL